MTKPVPNQSALPLFIRKHQSRQKQAEHGWPHVIDGTSCVVYLPRSILNKEQAATWHTHYARKGSLIEFLGRQWQVVSPSSRRLVLKADSPATDPVTVLGQYPEQIHRVEYKFGRLIPVGHLPSSWLVDLNSEEEEVQ